MVSSERKVYIYIYTQEECISKTLFASFKICLVLFSYDTASYMNVECPIIACNVQ